MSNNTIILNDCELALIRRSLKIRMAGLYSLTCQRGESADPYNIYEKLGKLYTDLGGDRDGIKDKEA